MIENIIDIEMIKMLLFYLNPWNVIKTGSFIGIIDVLTFIILPYLFLRKFYKKAWIRTIIFYIGFMFLQIHFRYLSFLEYALEVIGMILILYACTGDKNDKKNNNKGDNRVH